MGVPVPCPVLWAPQGCPPCGTEHKGTGAECWVPAWIRVQVLSDYCSSFFMPMGLQGWTKPSHLCRAAIGKGQGKMLLRFPPSPANPMAAPAPVPVPARPFPPQSSFYVAFWACLFAVFADSAQPCCPPDSSHSLGHGTAWGTAWPGRILHTHLQRAGPLGSAGAHLGGMVELPTISAGCRSVGTSRQRGPQCPPCPAHARMDDMSTLRIAKSPKTTSCAHGTPPKKCPAGSEGHLGGFKVWLGVQGGFCSALSVCPSLPAAPPAPAWQPRGLSPAAEGVTGPQQPHPRLPRHGFAIPASQGQGLHLQR